MFVDSLGNSDAVTGGVSSPAAAVGGAFAGVGLAAAAVETLRKNTITFT